MLRPKCGKTSICTSTSRGRNAQERKFRGETSTCMGRIIQGQNVQDEKRPDRGESETSTSTSASPSIQTASPSPSTWLSSPSTVQVQALTSLIDGEFLACDMHLQACQSMQRQLAGWWARDHEQLWLFVRCQPWAHGWISWSSTSTNASSCRSSHTMDRVVRQMWSSFLKVTLYSQHIRHWLQTARYISPLCLIRACLDDLHCVPKNVHLFVFQITLSKINRF